MPVFQSSSRVSDSPADALAVFCSDYRYQAGCREFLDEGLHLRDRYDLLAIPGGPQTLMLAEYLPKFSWAGWKWFRFLVDLHELKRLILIAHEDCGWYKSLPAFLHASRQPRERQEQDLRRICRSMAEKFPQLQVELYYAGRGEDGRMTIQPVSA
jgi:hypothetical protein